MAEVYTTLNVSLTREQATPVVSMVQGDTGRGLSVTLTDDIYVEGTGESEEGLTAQLWARKPSGKEVSLNASQVVAYESSNSYQIIFDGSNEFAQVIAEPGRTEVQVILLSDNRYVTSFDIFIDVQESKALGSDFESTEEYYSALKLMAKLEEQSKQLEQLADQFSDQLKLTVSVRYGTSAPTVQSGDKQGDIYIRFM